MARRRKATWSVPPSGSPSQQIDKPIYHQVPATFARRRPAPDASPDNAIVDQILEHDECPATFKLKARVVDYMPKDLSKSIVRLCGLCETLYVPH